MVGNSFHIEYIYISLEAFGELGHTTLVAQQGGGGGLLCINCDREVCQLGLSVCPLWRPKGMDHLDLICCFLRKGKPFWIDEGLHSNLQDSPLFCVCLRNAL